MNVANLVVLRVSGKDAIELASQFDNTPPPAELKFEPIRYPVNPEGTIFSARRTEGTGQTLEQLMEQPQRTYADVNLETANMLSQRENFEAVCRVLSAKEDPVRLNQFIIHLAARPKVGDDQAEAATRYIRQKARSLTRFSKDEIAAYIAKQTRFGDDESGLIPEFDTQ